MLPDPQSRAAHTLVELLATLAAAAVLGAIVLPTAHRTLDRVAVRAARDDVASLLEDGRRRALWRGTRIEVRFDSLTASVSVLDAPDDTALTRRLGGVHHVHLASDRSVIAYAPSGLGYGAANARIVVSRGASADTLWTSRLGRIRR